MLGFYAAEIDPAALERCRAGDPTALRAFVTCYQDRVFAFLSRALGSGPHVEDLAQEVFLRACRGLSGFDAAGTARLSTWLLTISRRIAIDARRKRRLPVIFLDGELTLAPGTPETERRRMEIGRALERAAAALPDDQRDVFVLAEFHELEMREIASVLGIPENTVKTRLFRARERLRVLLRRVWKLASHSPRSNHNTNFAGCVARVHVGLGLRLFIGQTPAPWKSSPPSKLDCRARGSTASTTTCAIATCRRARLPEP